MSFEGLLNDSVLDTTIDSTIRVQYETELKYIDALRKQKTIETSFIGNDCGVTIENIGTCKTAQV